MEAEAGLDHTYLTDHARTDQSQQFPCLWMAAIHKGFHQEDIMAQRRFDDRHGLGIIERERFLTEHMFSCLSSFDGPLGMERMRKGQKDSLHTLVSETSS